MGKHAKAAIVLLITILTLVCGCAHLRPKPSFDAEAAERAYYHFSLADQATIKGNLEEAISQLKLAIQYDPESAILRVHLASLYLASGDLASARSLLEEALVREPNHIIAHKILGGLCLAEGNLECAESHYRAILKIDPGNQDAVKYLIHTLNQQSRLKEALDVLEGYISAKPDDLNAQFELVEIYIFLGENAKALDTLNKIIAERPRNATAILARASLLEEMGRRDEARLDYLQAIALDPQNTDSRTQLIRLCLDLHDFKCAREQLEGLRQSSADEKIINIHEGLYFFSTRAFSKAAERFEAMLQENPDDSYVTLLLGLSLKNARAYDRAEDVLESIPEESQQRYNALLALAEICNSKKDPCTFEYLEKARNMNSEDYQTYLIEGSYYVKIGDLESAKLALQKAELLSADSQDALYSIGLLYEKMGMWERSIELAMTILKKNPEDPDALNFVGYTYADRGAELDEAERLLLKAVQLRPYDGFITDSLGWCYFKQGRYDEAKILLEKAAELTPFEPTIWEHLGELYQTLGNRKRAKEMFLKALELDPEPEQRDKIKEKLERLGR